MSDDFDDADTSDFFTIKEHVGDLVIIAVNEFTPKFPTINGERDTIHAEVVVVEGKGADTRYGEALLFGSKLVPQLRNKIGSTILGRIQLGDKQPGKNAPYILEKATEQDKNKASKWVNVHGIVASTAPSAKNVTGRTLTSVAAGDSANDEDIPF